MKLFSYRLLFLSILLCACTTTGSPAAESVGEMLVVTDGTIEKSYAVADLEAIQVAEASFNEITYVGVPLSVLLEDAGFSLQELRAVKAVASDGYSVNYDPALFLRENVIVAYATIDGSLTKDDGTFRMVLPGEEGNVNIRMLVKLQVLP